MGSCLSNLTKHDIDPAGSLAIVDSVVISNSRVRVNGNLIQLPITNLKSGESSVINIDPKKGRIVIQKGFYGRLEHNSLLEEIQLDEDIQKKNIDIHRSTMSL